MKLATRGGFTGDNPPHRQVFAELLQAQAPRLRSGQAVGLGAAKDRIDDVGREAGQAEHAADVGVFLRSCGRMAGSSAASPGTG
jgi:hypothetical protein